MAKNCAGTGTGDQERALTSRVLAARVVHDTDVIFLKPWSPATKTSRWTLEGSEPAEGMMIYDEVELSGPDDRQTFHFCYSVI